MKIMIGYPGVLTGYTKKAGKNLQVKNFTLMNPELMKMIEPGFGSGLSPVHPSFQPGKYPGIVSLRHNGFHCHVS
jgi:hypothetical protein